MRKLVAVAFGAVLLVAPQSAFAQDDFVYGSSGSLFAELILNGGASIRATDQGWYRSDGTHITTNTNYITGRCCGNLEHRSFFMFAIPNMTIFSAVLRLNTADVRNGPNEVYFVDYLGSTSTLTAGTGGMGAFNDLGSGRLYGSRVYTSADINQWRDVTLNANALATINSMRGSSFVVGGTLDATNVNPNVVPEPMSMVLLGTGLLGLGGVARRKRRRENQNAAA